MKTISIFLIAAAAFVSTALADVHLANLVWVDNPITESHSWYRYEVDANQRLHLQTSNDHSDFVEIAYPLRTQIGPPNTKSARVLTVLWRGKSFVVRRESRDSDRHSKDLFTWFTEPYFDTDRHILLRTTSDRADVILVSYPSRIELSRSDAGTVWRRTLSIQWGGKRDVFQVDELERHDKHPLP